MASQNQTWTIYRGEDVTFTLTGEDNTNPSAWTLLVSLSNGPGAAIVLSTTSVTVAGAGPYTLTFSFTRAQTSLLTKSQYWMDAWRTSDSGSNIRLAGGVVDIETPVRLPATS